MAWFKSLLPPIKGAKAEKPPETVKRRKPKRPLSAEDHALWAHVTRSATPLPGREVPSVEAVLSPPAVEKPVPALDMLHAPPASLPRSLPPLAGIERRMVKEVARGRRLIEARIDLHGLRQAEAHAALVGFIHRAHAAEAKLVLVITGKGDTSDRPGEARGVLRRMVPHWLADPVLRRMVIGYESAARGHGGEGALYVRIRRR